MNKQQAYLLSLGAEIHDICMKHGIRYFLGCGTLIGAVRHGGIIPWDDDFDILMPYEDWLEFKEVCQDPANLPPKRMLCAPDVQEAYFHVMPRYIALDTTCIHRQQSLHDDYAGYVIDIFVLDPVKNDPEEIARYHKDLFLYYDMISYSTTSSVRAAATPEEYEQAMALKEKLGKIEASKEFERRLASHFDPDGDLYIHRWQGSGTQYRRSDFAESLLAKVGPYEFMIPRGFNGVLRASFNDEWPEMPRNANAAKHSAPESHEFSYRDALTYYRPTHDRDELRRKMIARRPAVLKAGFEGRYLEDSRIKAKAHFAKLEVEQRIARHQQEFERALVARDGQTLDRIMGRFVSWQIGGPAVGRRTTKLFWRTHHPVLADVSDEVYDALLIALICTERIGRAHQILRVSKQISRPLTPFAAQAFEDLELFRSATDDVCFGRVADALEKARSLKVRYVNAVTFYYLEVECLWRLHRAGELALEEVAAAIEAALGRFEGNGFFLKYQADCKTERGIDVGDAYLVAAESTMNGLILTDIQQRFGYAPSWLRRKPWAKANGVPQWEGKWPRVKKPAKKLDTPEDVLNENQRCLLLLMGEVTELCRSNNLRCICSPAVAKGLFVKKNFPERLNDHCLLMPAADLRKLIDILPGSYQNRRVSYMGNDPSCAGLFVKYSSTKSCVLKLNENPAEQDKELGIRIFALTNAQVPAPANVYLRAWKAGVSEGVFVPRGLSLKAKAFLRGLHGRTAKTGKKIFDMIAALPEPTDVYATELGGADQHVAASFVRECEFKSFAGVELAVPKDLKAYIENCDARFTRYLLNEGKKLLTPYLSYEEVIASGALDADWYEHRLRYEQIRTEVEGDPAEFSENYDQLRLAVDLKTISLELLPQRDKIAELHAKRDVETLEKVLKPYIDCWDKYHEVGQVFLDIEIDAALQFVLDQRKAD